LVLGLHELAISLVWQYEGMQFMTQLVIPSYPIVITPPQGMSSLPMVEINKNGVQQKYSRVRLRKGSPRRQAADCSFGNFTDHLGFTAWEFFHAAKKTELANSFTNAVVDRRAFAFSLEHEDTFIWNTGNLRKTDSSVFALEDFASAGLAGRIGEAIAYLTMIKAGYVFWDRCATVWERAARSTNITHSERLRVAQYLSSQVASGRPQNEPDFIFEKSNGDVALMEAKGSIVNPAKDDPSTKTDLKQALKQLAAWSAVISPTPQKSYGIGTYLREEHDNNSDPSLIAYVDPPGQKKEDIRPSELPPDLVRRCNYGSWLLGMGLFSAGRALREGEEKNVEAIDLPTVEVNGGRFVYTVTGFKSLPGHGRSLIYPLDWIDAVLNPWPQSSGLFVMGVEQGVMQLITEALHRPKASTLKRNDGHELPEFARHNNKDSSWSVMPDGSFLGILDHDTLNAGFKGMVKYKL
jgi:hypothetical protein